MELPIIVKTEGPGSETPITFLQLFQKTVKDHGSCPALSEKINNVWVTISYSEYYQSAYQLAAAFTQH